MNTRMTSGVELLEAVPEPTVTRSPATSQCPAWTALKLRDGLKAAGCRNKLVFLSVSEDGDFVCEAAVTHSIPEGHPE